MSHTIRVQLKQKVDRSYKIEIRSGLLDEIASFVVQRGRRNGVYLITDSNVERLWGQRVLRQLYDAGIDAILLSFPAGESSKNYRVVHALHTQLLANGVRRDSLVVALGGGLVGDVAGYVAATVLRGVTYVQIPTTLLSQVDSSVGGKVGINHSIGKNLIGSFHQPIAVLIDPDVLQTLPEKEFRGGLAEVVKIAAALDRMFFKYLERQADTISKSNPKLLARMISRAVALKAAVVESDEFESGLRKSLNLGHTFGHAIELATDFSLRHGEAVSIGMAAEARIAVRMGVLSKHDMNRLLALLKVLRLPTAIPRNVNPGKFFSALSADKKSIAGSTKFVLPAGIGRCAIGVDVPAALVREVLTGKNRVHV